MGRSLLLLSTVAVVIIATTGGGMASQRDSAAKVEPATVPERIAWYGTLKSALDEAARTQRPVFLLAARPCASGVPGFW